MLKKKKKKTHGKEYKSKRSELPLLQSHTHVTWTDTPHTTHNSASWHHKTKWCLSEKKKSNQTKTKTITLAKPKQFTKKKKMYPQKRKKRKKPARPDRAEPIRQLKPLTTSQCRPSSRHAPHPPGDPSTARPYRITSPPPFYLFLFLSPPYPYSYGSCPRHTSSPHQHLSLLLLFSPFSPQYHKNPPYTPPPPT